MLILQRTAGQAFTVGDNIRVTVAGVDGGTVRLLVQAPDELLIAGDERPTPPHRTDRAQRWVLNHSKATGVAYRVLRELAFRVDSARAGWVWPTVEEIAESLNTDPRNVRRVLAMLESDGELEVEHSLGRRPNRYRLPLR